MAAKPIVLLAGLLALAGAPAQAHHSYVIYDIVDKQAITGTVVSYRYGQPHPILILDEILENGEHRRWTFEGVSIMMWNRLELPTDIATAGETLTVTGWPARSGDAKMLLSSVIRDGVETMLLREVMQREAREAAGLLPARPLMSASSQSLPLL